MRRNHHHHSIKLCIPSIITEGEYLLLIQMPTIMFKDFTNWESVSGDQFGFVLNITDIKHAALVFLIMEKRQ